MNYYKMLMSMLFPIKNIKKIKIIKSWVEPTEENSRGDNDPAAIRGDNN